MGCVFKHKGRSTYWIKYKSAGKWQYESSHSTLERDAKRLLRLREGDTANGIPITSDVGRLTIAEGFADVVNYHISRQRDVKKLQRRIAMHLEPFFGATTKMVAVNTAHAEAYRARRLQAGAKPATVNRELGLLKQAFNLAVRYRRLTTKPHIPMAPEHNTRTGFLEVDQMRAILPHLTTNVRPLVVALYFTGWRRGELLKLQWRNVDRARMQLRLEPGTTKNHEGRTFPYGAIADLRAVMDQQWAVHEDLKQRGVVCPYVFNRNGLPIKAFVRGFKAACRKAGFPGRIPHDMRRSAARNLERAGVPRAVSMKMTGHKTESMFRRYSIASEADLQVASEKLGALFTSELRSGTK